MIVFVFPDVDHVGRVIVALDGVQDLRPGRVGGGRARSRLDIGLVEQADLVRGQFLPAAAGKRAAAPPSRNAPGRGG
ncbi:MAG: hypothetical protein R3E68_07035 [Burkholderiaceae bacterium]